LDRSLIDRAILDLEYALSDQELSPRLVSRLNAHVSSIPAEYQALFSSCFNSINEAIEKDDFEIAKKPIDRLIGLYDFLLESKYLRDSEAQLGDQLSPTIHLANPDRDKILTLISEMRELIKSSLLFDIPHKRRLLDRISAIEIESYKDQGKLDVFLGGVVDVGEALGKFGESAKPLFDRMAEVVGIARSSSKEYEQLPPPETQKQLPPPKKDE
jgi:hypothetical protein